jgi:hypothetical protein
VALSHSGPLTRGPDSGFAGCPGGHRAGETWHPEPCVICTCQVRQSGSGPNHQSCSSCRAYPRPSHAQPKSGGQTGLLPLPRHQCLEPQAISAWTVQREQGRAQCLPRRQGPCSARGPHAPNSTVWRATPHLGSAAPSAGQVTSHPPAPPFPQPQRVQYLLWGCSLGGCLLTLLAVDLPVILVTLPRL